MKPGSWGSIWLAYFYTILAMASVGKLVPIEEDIERALHTTPAGVGFAISLVAVSSAVASTIGGAIIDRIGARRAIVGTCIVMVFCNLASFFSTSILMLDVTRVIEGIEFIGIVVAAPALIMATTTGQRQVRAMALWSTYTPVGYTLGLLLAVPFAGTASWRWTFIVHGALFAAAIFLGGLLPEVPGRPSAESANPGKSRVAELFSIYGKADPWKLSVSNALLVSIGLGTSTVMPIYLARTHHITVAHASSILAVANLAMIGGAAAAGYLLTRGVRAIRIYLALAVGGVISGFFLYAPWISFRSAISSLVVWQLTSGAAVAILMALLPTVAEDPSRGGAAAGLVGQVMAFGNIITPPLYLSLLSNHKPLQFVALIISGWLISLAFLPAWKHRPAAPPSSS